MNLSVSIHVPCPCHKNIPLKMTFLVGSFSKDMRKEEGATENQPPLNLQSTSQRSSVGELVFTMAHKKRMMQEWAFGTVLAAADHRS